MITIPNQEDRQWKKANNSDLFGNISVTKNLCFDEEGYLKLSASPRAAIDESVDTDFNRVVSIIRSEDHGYLAFTSEEIFNIELDILSATPVQNSDTGTFSTDLQSDATWFGGLLAVSQDTDLDYYNPVTNAWVDTNIVLTGTIQSQHIVKNFLSFNQLAVADVNTVALYSSPITATPTLVRTLTIPSNYYITSMVYFNSTMYIGTMNRYSGKAALFLWNGEGTGNNGAFEVDSNIIFDVCVFQDSVVCFIGNGSILRFNGSGFTFLDAFPVFYTSRVLTDDSNLGIQHNCLKSNGDVLYISFSDSENSQHRLLNMPSGVWCYDPKVGLYHKYSYSISRVIKQAIGTASVNTTTNQITISAPPFTGTECFYRANGGTVMGGLTDEGKYFVIKVDATHIKLATTLANALAGTAVDITGTGTDFVQTLVFFPNTDYGQFMTNRPAAIYPIPIPRGNTQYGTDLLWSAETATRTAIGVSIAYLGTVSDNAEARGYFITPKVFSSNVTDTFNQLTLRYAPLSELDKIIIKYRVTDDGLKEIDASNDTYWKITWTSGTTFTTTDTRFATAVVGNEIEVLEGAAAGLLAHITAISLNAGTYTFTIDETFNDYTSGDISRAVFRNWTKFLTITSADSNGYIEQQLGVVGKFIQLKIELRGIEVKIEDLQVDNLYQLPSSNSSYQ